VPATPILSPLSRIIAFVACWLLAPCVTVAHPMGNFSINHYAGIRVGRDAVEIRYVIDMAEIPTFQEFQRNALVANSGDISARNYLAKQAESLRAGLRLTLNRELVPMQTESRQIIFSPGAGGLPTTKLTFRYRAIIAPPRHGQAGAAQYALYYRDDNFPSRLGWKEVIAAAGPGVTILNSSVPVTDRSGELSNYPVDLRVSPPADLEARLSLRSSVPAADRLGDKADKSVFLSVPAVESSLRSKLPGTPQSRFTQLITTSQTGIWFLIGAAAIAAGLGALHGLEPGHGKTIVAAYLVGSRGTAYHAVVLGLIVTAAHTAGVYALGAVTLYASRYIVPEQLYPWLGAISGLLMAALGSYLFLQRYADREIGHSQGPGGTHQHHHDHGQVFHPVHAHSHAHTHLCVPGTHGHSHEPHGRHEHPLVAGEVSSRQLLALGITGGIVPCPAALVVLLSAVALNRIAFGLLLIVAFSLGLAAVLIAVGLMMIYARRFMNRFRSEGPLITRWLPLSSAAVITFFGLAIAIRSLVAGGIFQIRL
jgi:ABC-type nickel/cobalt efflux system permease component RcnA